jgi:ribosomal protein S18 acetylase RimI-like enzyme
MIDIREYQPRDWPSLWRILHSAIAAGDTFAWDPQSTEAEVCEAWIEDPAATFVACLDGRVVGCYFIKSNQPGLGAHVCNAGYCVDPDARGRGIAARMCEHSQHQAKARGFRSMQFNFVVATNEPAVHLWQKLGFHIVGRLPGAYRHAQLGFVDALVMFKSLAD